ncbi:type 11 methyltransferase/S-adenosylmethionine-dependent methyltransferase 3-like protein 1 [Halorubrum californiense DSM 19288]|uniref:Type 11 methyltransferase/S-adenosylmethionine-dependent methyltransferase 3-like protein 1 n=1 Tax=Halorubrum californiense DSM 19288 TaxID=1227465 RepID=M0E4D0_9EURY|nr:MULTISPECIES: class I SAM-dependent methyltransferase [Halorubrum]ELZ41219.1 type 11 methyltransferase/S-adenosylmethionine-dependent methyltransferase 3-like protein 1 [Halorubrum californiense DSM 19288]TKX72666.1 class I SAM-dependent methyltransferase [Halorubrum sp. GN11GM_10-3_MGM]
MERFQNTGQPDWDWWGKLWPTPGATLRDLGIGAGQSVAEVGCGSGYFALPAARIVEPAPVYAVDLDAALLDELGSLAERQAIGNVVTVRGDARDLTELLPERVDALVVANTFHGVDDRPGFVEEAFEAIEPGGSLIVVNWRDRPREATTVGGEPRGPPTELRMPPEETETAVTRAAPFDFDRRVDLPPYHYALVFDR